jgi:hypothetical protein
MCHSKKLEQIAKMPRLSSAVMIHEIWSAGEPLISLKTLARKQGLLSLHSCGTSNWDMSKEFPLLLLITGAVDRDIAACGLRKSYLAQTHVGD